MTTDKPPPPELDQVLNTDEMQLLAKRITEIRKDSGHGKLTIIIYNKTIVGMDITKTLRGSNDNNSS